jgi:membrane AbrB-like protein
MTPLAAWRGWALLLGASAGAAYLLTRAALPGALFLGPMLAAMVFGIAGFAQRLPRRSLGVAQGIVGCTVAQTITLPVLLTLARNWPAALLIVPSILIASCSVGWSFARWGKLPGTTMILGCSPGAAAATVAMAEELGADPRIVAIMQYLRVIIVILSASLVSRFVLGDAMALPGTASRAFGGPVDLAGTAAIALIGTFFYLKVRLPAGGLIIPVLLGTLGQASGLLQIAMPVSVTAIAYAALGWSVGLSFNLQVLRYALYVLPQLLLATVLLLLFCALPAWLLAEAFGVDALTAYLAASPGGLDSVAIIAVASKANMPFVLAIHALRLVAVSFTLPLVARFYASRA